jgi:hypothetical protein
MPRQRRLELFDSNGTATTGLNSITSASITKTKFIRRQKTSIMFAGAVIEHFDYLAILRGSVRGWSAAVAWRQISKQNGLSPPSCQGLIICTNVVPIASQVHQYKGGLKWPHVRCGLSSIQEPMGWGRAAKGVFYKIAKTNPFRPPLMKLLGKY